MYHIIAKNKEGTEAFAEEVKRVFPAFPGTDRCYIEPVRGSGFFGSYDDIVCDVDIIRVCAGGSIVKIRLKGDVRNDPSCISYPGNPESVLRGR